jgi:hypothetical protein
MKRMFGSKKEHTESSSIGRKSIDTQIKPITLEDVKQQQDKILEMVSTESFQERLCAMIQEEIHTAVLKHSELAQRKIIGKMEANIANLQFVIVNKVVEEVTNHIDRRIEKRIKDLERQIEQLEKSDKIKSIC